MCFRIPGKLIPSLGGLHISINFLKAIGDHMDGSGLADMWLESGLLGAGTVELVLAGIQQGYQGSQTHHVISVVTFDANLSFVSL